VTNLADGIALAAGPLLVASLTSDPFLISLAAAVQWLPPLLFGLWAGAVSDRLDRRFVVLAANLLRVALLAILAALVTGDVVPVWTVLSALFLLGAAEVFADNTTSTLVPTLVTDRDDLPLANARIQTGFITVNQMAGPPLGAALFAAGTAWPFASQALLVALGALLVSRIQLPPSNRTTESLGSVWHDVRQGIAWTWRHRAVRILIVTGTVFSGAYGIAWSVLVLYATERLDLGQVGFGLITTVGALGGLAGTASYGRLTRRYSLAQLLRAGLVVETLTHLALAETSTPWLAQPVLFLIGAHD
jgi:MFS family permease